MSSPPVIDSNRVQIKLNGRRFEFDKETAINSCALFKKYFDLQENKEAQEALTKSTNPPFSAEQIYEHIAPTLYHQKDQEEEQAKIPKMFCFTFLKLPTLIPDFFGPIQVSLRKNRIPSFNWKEMNRPEQEAVAWIVHTFGIDKFEQFKNVTAAPLEEGVAGKEAEADDIHGDNDTNKNKKVGPTCEELAKMTMRSVEVAAETAYAATSTSASAAASETSATATSSVRPVIDDDDEDENLVLTKVGCYYCGLATHSTDVCEHNPRNQKKE